MNEDLVGTFQYLELDTELKKGHFVNLRIIKEKFDLALKELSKCDCQCHNYTFFHFQDLNLLSDKKKFYLKDINNNSLQIYLYFNSLDYIDFNIDQYIIHRINFGIVQ